MEPKLQKTAKKKVEKKPQPLDFSKKMLYNAFFIFFLPPHGRKMRRHCKTILKDLLNTAFGLEDVQQSLKSFAMRTVLKRWSIVVGVGLFLVQLN